MAITRTINIDGKEVKFKASAAIPRIYRIRFGRDIYKDLAHLEKAVSKQDPENSSLDSLSLEVFENVAYIMARYADSSIPESVEEWLDEFNTFSIYEVLPEIIELWQINVKGDIQAKKNLEKLKDR